jgi:hypothetical protein
MKKEVGREILFSFLGIVLSNVGYKKVIPYFKNGRRVGYKGFTLLSTIKTIITVSKPSTKSAKYALTPGVVEKWMADHYCEGSTVI